MKQRHLKYQKLITFSRWSRKKYAVLASLGKQIKIGNVRLEICQLALLKAEKSQVLLELVHPAIIVQEVPDDIIDVRLSELRTISVTAKSDIFTHLRIYNFLNKHYQRLFFSFQILHKEISFFVSGCVFYALKIKLILS